MAIISRTKATLRISGPDLDPEDITNSLGGFPTLSRKKGDVIRSKNGNERVAAFGQWHVSAPEMKPGNLDTQICEILDGLSSNIDDWVCIADNYSVDMYCGLFMEQQMEGIDIDPDTLQKLGQRKIILDLDIYGAD